MEETARERFDAEYTRFIEFYGEVNSVVIASEREALDLELNMSAVVELRSAFSHVMRVQAVLYATASGLQAVRDSGFTEEQYCSENLTKAYGHLYRAGYDAYDTLALALEVEVEDIIQEVSQTAIYEEIHDPGESVFRKRRAARKLMDEAKISKDVNCEADARAFTDMERATGMLVEVRDLLQDQMPELVQRRNYRAKENRRNLRLALALAALGAVLGYPAWKLLEWIVQMIWR